MFIEPLPDTDGVIDPACWSAPIAKASSRWAWRMATRLVSRSARMPLDVSHSVRLGRVLRRGVFEVRVDALRKVIAPALSAGRRRTITDEIIEPRGAPPARMAHSVETWRDGQLVGGLGTASTSAARSSGIRVPPRDRRLRSRRDAGRSDDPQRLHRSTSSGDAASRAVRGDQIPRAFALLKRVARV
jgi:hypothetical protein